MLTAVVLAAGFSSRMGVPKALLVDREGCPFVVRIVRTLADAGLHTVTVVSSASLRDPIVDVLSTGDVPAIVRVVVNPDPGRGQLSSIWTGMDAALTDAAVASRVSGMLLTLVDVPFVSSATVRAVIGAHAAGALIARPAAGDRHGHPVILDAALFAELRAADPAVGAKAVVHAHKSEIVDVAVADEGAFTDIDTPADYGTALRGAAIRPS